MVRVDHLACCLGDAREVWFAGQWREWRGAVGNVLNETG